MRPERSALGMSPFPRFAYMEVGKGREPWMAETLKTKRYPGRNLSNLFLYRSISVEMDIKFPMHIRN